MSRLRDPFQAMNIRKSQRLARLNQREPSALEVLKQSRLHPAVTGELGSMLLSHRQSAGSGKRIESSTDGLRPKGAAWWAISKLDLPPAARYP